MMQKSQQLYQIIPLQILAWHLAASGEWSGTATVILGGWISFIAEKQLGKTSWNRPQETWTEKWSGSKKKKKQWKSFMRREQELERFKTRILLNIVAAEQSRNKINRRNSSPKQYRKIIPVLAAPHRPGVVQEQGQ